MRPVGAWWIHKFAVDRPLPAACARGKTRDIPHSGCDIDVELHLRMDAAEHQEGTGGGEADFHSLAGLLRPGIEVDRGIEYPHVVGPAVVVDDPQSLAADQCDIWPGYNALPSWDTVLTFC